MALDIDPSHNDPTLHLGEKFAVQEAHVVLPKLPRIVFSQMGSCHKVIREMILEELTRSVQLGSTNCGCGVINNVVIFDRQKANILSRGLLVVQYTAWSS